jgi:hypothetical protein
MGGGGKGGGGGQATKERAAAAVAPAEGALDFEERDQAADAWGVQAFGEWWDSLTGEEKMALRSYQNMSYADINDYLRGGSMHRAYSDADIRGLMASIDRALDKARLPRDVVAYRGIFSSGKIFGSTPEGLVGRTITDKGFLSTSLNRKVSRETFAGKGPDAVTLRIKVPKGTRGGYLGSLGSRHAADERELLLSRGRKYRVTKVRKTDKGYIADAELL